MSTRTTQLSIESTVWYSTSASATYVMILSSPQAAMPSMAFVCALHTARGRMMVRSHTTTKPSASPVTRRSLRLMKVAAWTEALWPRRTDFGCRGTLSAIVRGRRGPVAGAEDGAGAGGASADRAQDGGCGFDQHLFRRVRDPVVELSRPRPVGILH